MMSDDFDAAIGAALEAEINAKSGKPADDEDKGAPEADAEQPEAAVAAEPEAEPQSLADRVHYEKRGNLGVISLHRPEALNAIDLDMVRAIDGYVSEADADDEVLTIVLWSPEGRAFCAGGDIRQLWEWGRGGKRELFLFYREEYQLNQRLATLRTPYLSLMDGIVMGGGAGLALHAPHRVVSETVTFAMPEVGIGFVPDVGSTKLLSGMPGRTGRYLALTGERISGADMIWGGLADTVVPREQHANLLDRLADGETATEVTEAFGVDADESALSGLAETIDETFEGSVEAVLDALDAFEGERSEWAAATAATIRKQCPFSVLGTEGLMERAAGASLEDCLVNEFRAATRVVQRQDFYEGVRAAVVDKDRKPRWRPSSLDAVDRAELATLFEPSPMRDVSFPER
ncbi:MAG: enoyl-CoA hydratase/isomerase family protein [Pseudomonadota bacterium]